MNAVETKPKRNLKKILLGVLAVIVVLLVVAVAAVFAVWHNEIGTVASIKMLRDRNDDHLDGAVYSMNVKGDFYLDDTIVWGPALLRAYELEDKIAIYPRIILDEIVTNVLSGSTIKNDFVRVDQDGLRFLNYMDIWHFSGQMVSAAFEHMKAEARRADGTYPDKVFQKLYWHMNYINAESDKKNEKQDRNYRLAL